MLHEETCKLGGNLVSLQSLDWLIDFSYMMLERICYFHWWLTSWSGFKCWTDHCRATWQTGSRFSNQFFCPKGQGKPTTAMNQSWAGRPLILNNNNYNFEWSSSSHNAFFLCIVLMTLLHTARQVWSSSGFLNMSVMLDIWCCFLTGLVTAGHL